MNLYILDKIRKIGKTHGWHEIDHQENIKMISFGDMGSRINVYYSTGTVATVLDHPKLGRQTLYRRGVRTPQLEEIFKNPRVHLGTGYHRKKGLAIN